VVDLNFMRDLLIAFGMFVGAGLGLPFPEEVLMVGAGIWTAAHADQYGAFAWLMLPVCIVGVVIADLLLYGIGRHFGTRLLRVRWVARLMPAEKLLKIEDNFHHYGVGILLFGRLLPGIRAPLFLTAGMMRLPMARFLVADGVGAVFGNSLLFFLGWWFGDAFMDLVRRAGSKLEHVLGPVLIMSAVVAVTTWLVLRYVRRPMAVGDPKEVPLIGSKVAARLDYGDPASRDKPECREAQVEAVKPAVEAAAATPSEQESLSTGASARPEGG
jgi:membrane protein DedA with SNARE-associated domain